MFGIRKRQSLQRRLENLQAEKEQLLRKNSAQAAQLTQLSDAIAKRNLSLAHLRGVERALAQSRRDLKAALRKQAADYEKELAKLRKELDTA